METIRLHSASIGENRPSMSSQGFSLLELMLVLLLLGVVYGLAGPALIEKPVGLELNSASRQLTAGFRRARDVAVAQRQESVLTLDIKAKTFTVSHDPRIYDLPKTLSFSLFTAQSELVRSEAGSIRFFPDGSSTGGRVTFAAGSDQRSIDVDWITGRAKAL